jgi:hypothetical protein
MLFLTYRPKNRFARHRVFKIIVIISMIVVIVINCEFGPNTRGSEYISFIALCCQKLYENQRAGF